MLTISQETFLKGSPICRGIAIGKPYFLTLVEDIVPELSIEPKFIDEEVRRYRDAFFKAKEDIVLLQKSLQKERVFDGIAILEAHLEIMQDPLLTVEIETKIREEQKNAEFILQGIITQFKEKFNSLDDPFFRERFKDLKDISKRVIGYLRESVKVCLVDIPPDSIIFSSDLTAFDISEANSSFVNAFVTKEGGATSHAAIVAKAKGVPYVSSVDLDIVLLGQVTCVIVDGRTGEIILNPLKETVLKYQLLRDQLSQHLQKLTHIGKLVAETYDGYRIRLSANIERVEEIDMLHQYGGCGVGLLRTESAFLAKETFPPEEEQYQTYRHFVEKMNGLPIVIRTFDLGGDKYLRNHVAQECNPFLGCRAIRFLLREKEIFKAQLKAILRASAHGNVRVMFPMVSTLSELLEAKEILNQSKQELKAQGFSFSNHIPVGCMIEVPSAAITADLLAKECDFLSIGTNDLVQYSLAVDRSNNALRDLYTPTHPSVLRLIKMVVSEANHYGIPVTVCGEVAADPRFTPLLLGFGVHEFSVASRYLPIVKNAIRATSIVAANKLAEKALTFSSPKEVEALLTCEYRQNVPEDCFYNC